MDDKRNEVLCPRCGVRINDNKTNMCMRCGYLFNSNEAINRRETATGQIQPDKKSVVFMAVALGNLFTIVPGIIYFGASFLLFGSLAEMPDWKYYGISYLIASYIVASLVAAVMGVINKIKNGEKFKATIISTMVSFLITFIILVAIHMIQG